MRRVVHSVIASMELSVGECSTKGQASLVIEKQRQWKRWAEEQHEQRWQK